MFRLNNAQSWDYIENRFRTDFGETHVKMVQLIQYMRDSGISERLFGYSSMDKLVISVYEKIDPAKEALHITFDSETNRWHFQYFAVPYKDPEFVRDYQADKGIEKLNSFLNYINW